jgi:O-antigen ligase
MAEELSRPGPISSPIAIIDEARARLRAVDLAALLRAGLAAVVLGLVFALAIADGGRNPACLFFVQAIVFLLLAGVIARGARGIRLPATWWWLAGAIAVTSITSVRPEASVRELLLWITYAGIAVLTAVSLREHREWFVDGLVLTAGALCLIALFWFWGSGDLASRWCSTFYWPNPFAAFLLLVLPLTLVRAIRAPSAREAMSHGAASVLFLTSLVFTYSRGAWLAGIVTVGVGAALLRTSRRRSALMRFAGIALATAVAVGLLSLASRSGQSSAVAARAASIADPGDASARGHVLFWRNALRIFADRPWTGTGPGTFGAVHAAYQTDLRFYARDAHSLYLQTAAESGIGGLAGLLALLAAMAFAWARMLRRTAEEPQYSLVLGGGLGLLAFLLHNAVDMDWSFPANPAMAFALAGVLGSIAIAQRSPSVPPARGWKRMPVLGVAALLAATVVVFRTGEANRLFVQGQTLASAGRWDEACDVFVQAQAWNPLHARYLGAEAEARMRILPPQRIRAEAALRRAMQLDRANAWQPWQLANVLASVPGVGPREFEEPERLLRGALRLDPLNRPKIYSALAELYVRWARPADAARVYDTAVDRYLGHPTGEARVPLPAEAIDLMAEAGAFRLDAGDRAGAERILRDVLVEGPRAANRPPVRALMDQLRQHAVETPS